MDIFFLVILSFYCEYNSVTWADLMYNDDVLFSNKVQIHTGSYGLASFH